MHGDLELFEAQSDSRDQLVHAEATITRAMKNAWREVGAQLGFIRNQNLYLLVAPTFDAYCLNRWEMTEQRASQLIQAAAVVDQISTIVEKHSTDVEIVDCLPVRESHVRPLLRLESPRHRAEVWQRVIDSGQNVTAKVVEAEVERKIAELAKEYVTLSEWEAMSEDDRNRLLEPRVSDKTFNRTNDNIEWAWWSWNPVTGCEHDCGYCYARDIANRFNPQGFTPSFYPSRVSAPANMKVPALAADAKAVDKQGSRTVFVCSMADLFGEWVPQEWIDAVMESVRNASDWTFIFLTKNPARMATIDWPANAWAGTTVDVQARVAPAQAAFINVNAPVRFLSCEPLLEDLQFSDMGMFDWLIIGGQSKSTRCEELHPPFAWTWRLLRQWEELHDVSDTFYEKTNLQSRSRAYPSAR